MKKGKHRVVVLLCVLLSLLMTCCIATSCGGPETEAKTKSLISRIDATCNDVTTLTLADEEDLLSISALYKSLSSEQKGLVTNYSKLQAALAQVGKLKEIDALTVTWTSGNSVNGTQAYTPAIDLESATYAGVQPVVTYSIGSNTAIASIKADGSIVATGVGSYTLKATLSYAAGGYKITKTVEKSIRVYGYEVTGKVVLPEANKDFYSSVTVATGYGTPVNANEDGTYKVELPNGTTTLTFSSAYFAGVTQDVTVNGAAVAAGDVTLSQYKWTASGGTWSQNGANSVKLAATSKDSVQAMLFDAPATDKYVIRSTISNVEQGYTDNCGQRAVGFALYGTQYVMSIQIRNADVDFCLMKVDTWNNLKPLTSSTLKSMTLSDGTTLYDYFKGMLDGTSSATLMAARSGDYYRFYAIENAGTATEKATEFYEWKVTGEDGTYLYTATGKNKIGFWSRSGSGATFSDIVYSTDSDYVDQCFEVHATVTTYAADGTSTWGSVEETSGFGSAGTTAYGNTAVYTITPVSGKKILSVMVNGEDYTDQVKNNKLSLKITGSSYDVKVLFGEQSTSSLSVAGTITVDSNYDTGAGVNGATIEASKTISGVKFVLATATANANGEFTLTGLDQNATYTISASVPGFAKSEADVNLGTENLTGQAFSVSDYALGTLLGQSTIAGEASVTRTGNTFTLTNSASADLSKGETTCMRVPFSGTSTQYAIMSGTISGTETKNTAAKVGFTIASTSTTNFDSHWTLALGCSQNTLVLINNANQNAGLKCEDIQVYNGATVDSSNGRINLPNGTISYSGNAMAATKLTVVRDGKYVYGFVDDVLYCRYTIKDLDGVDAELGLTKFSLDSATFTNVTIKNTKAAVDVLANATPTITGDADVVIDGLVDGKASLGSELTISITPHAGKYIEAVNVNGAAIAVDTVWDADNKTNTVTATINVGGAVAIEVLTGDSSTLIKVDGTITEEKATGVDHTKAKVTFNDGNGEILSSDVTSDLKFSLLIDNAKTYTVTVKHPQYKDVVVEGVTADNLTEKLSGLELKMANTRFVDKSTGTTHFVESATAAGTYVKAAANEDKYTQLKIADLSTEQFVIKATFTAPTRGMNSQANFGFAIGNDSQTASADYQILLEQQGTGGLYDMCVLTTGGVSGSSWNNYKIHRTSYNADATTYTGLDAAKAKIFVDGSKEVTLTLVRKNNTFAIYVDEYCAGTFYTNDTYFKAFNSANFTTLAVATRAGAGVTVKDIDWSVADAAVNAYMAKLNVTEGATIEGGNGTAGGYAMRNGAFTATVTPAIGDIIQSINVTGGTLNGSEANSDGSWTLNITAAGDASEVMVNITTVAEDQLKTVTGTLSSTDTYDWANAKIIFSGDLTKETTVNEDGTYQVILLNGEYDVTIETKECVDYVLKNTVKITDANTTVNVTIPSVVDMYTPDSDGTSSGWTVIDDGAGNYTFTQDGRPNNGSGRGELFFKDTAGSTDFTYSVKINNPTSLGADSKVGLIFATNDDHSKNYGLFYAPAAQEGTAKFRVISGTSVAYNDGFGAANITAYNGLYVTSNGRLTATNSLMKDKIGIDVNYGDKNFTWTNDVELKVVRKDAIAYLFVNDVLCGKYDFAAAYADEDFTSLKSMVGIASEMNDMDINGYTFVSNALKADETAVAVSGKIGAADGSAVIFTNKADGRTFITTANSGAYTASLPAGEYDVTIATSATSIKTTLTVAAGASQTAKLNIVALEDSSDDDADVTVTFGAGIDSDNEAAIGNDVTIKFAPKAEGKVIGKIYINGAEVTTGITADGFNKSWTGKAVANAEGKMVVKAEVVDAVTATGKVAFASDNGLDITKAEIKFASADFNTAVNANADGTFSAYVVAGTYTVTVSHPALESVVKENVEVTASGAIDDITLSANYTLGTLLGKNATAAKASITRTGNDFALTNSADATKLGNDRLQRITFSGTESQYAVITGKVSTIEVSGTDDAPKVGFTIASTSDANFQDQYSVTLGTQQNTLVFMKGDNQNLGNDWNPVTYNGASVFTSNGRIQLPANTLKNSGNSGMTEVELTAIRDGKTIYGLINGVLYASITVNDLDGVDGKLGFDKNSATTVNYKDVTYKIHTAESIKAVQKHAASVTLGQVTLTDNTGAFNAAKTLVADNVDIKLSAGAVLTKEDVTVSGLKEGYTFDANEDGTISIAGEVEGSFVLSAKANVALDDQTGESGTLTTAGFIENIAKSGNDVTLTVEPTDNTKVVSKILVNGTAVEGTSATSTGFGLTATVKAVANDKGMMVVTAEYENKIVITGKIVDGANTGADLSLTTIVFVSERMTTSATVNASGEYTVYLMAGTYTATASHPRYEDATSSAQEVTTDGTFGDITFTEISFTESDVQSDGRTWAKGADGKYTLETYGGDKCHALMIDGVESTNYLVEAVFENPVGGTQKNKESSAGVATSYQLNFGFALTSGDTFNLEGYRIFLEQQNMAGNYAVKILNRKSWKNWDIVPVLSNSEANPVGYQKFLKDVIIGASSVKMSLYRNGNTFKLYLNEYLAASWSGAWDNSGASVEVEDTFNKLSIATRAGAGVTVSDVWYTTDGSAAETKASAYDAYTASTATLSLVEEAGATVEYISGVTEAEGIVTAEMGTAIKAKFTPSEEGKVVASVKVGKYEYFGSTDADGALTVTMAAYEANVVVTPVVKDAITVTGSVNTDVLDVIATFRNSDICGIDSTKTGDDRPLHAPGAYSVEGAAASYYTSVNAEAGTYTAVIPADTTVTLRSRIYKVGSTAGNSAYAYRYYEVNALEDATVDMTVGTYAPGDGPNYDPFLDELNTSKKSVRATEGGDRGMYLLNASDAPSNITNFTFTAKLGVKAGGTAKLGIVLATDGTATVDTTGHIVWFGAYQKVLRFTNGVVKSNYGSTDNVTSLTATSNGKVNNNNNVTVNNAFGSVTQDVWTEFEVKLIRVDSTVAIYVNGQHIANMEWSIGDSFANCFGFIKENINICFSNIEFSEVGTSVIPTI